MKNLLITGISGFIGSTAAFAVKGDYHVFGIDNMDPWGLPSLKQQRRERLLQSGIEVIYQDIRDEKALLHLVSERKVDIILHLAAQAGVRYSLENPEAYIEANIKGFLSVLEVVRRKPSIKLVYASSSSVYGLNEKVPYSIEDRTDRQASLYGVTKKTNELMASCYHHLFDLDVTGLRFFTVYGPWGRPDMAYFSFTEKLYAGETIDLYNEGLCERDFTYIDDIVAGITASLKLPRGNRLFNLGGQSPVSVIEFLGLLEKWTGKKAQVKYLPMQPGDVEKTFADLSHGRIALNFHPKISLDEGLRRFVAWYVDWKRLSNNLENK